MMAASPAPGKRGRGYSRLNKLNRMELDEKEARDGG